ncbi:MAG TPA: glycosyltransferase WbuB [Burkholderiales bacterium]
MQPLPDLRRNVASTIGESTGAQAQDSTHALRILVHGINYAPELTGIGKYTGELCDWLAQRGHAVRVITAPPYYPEWRVQRGYTAFSYRRERRNGVLVQRCPLLMPRKPTGARRVAHLASFAVSSAPLVVAACWWRPDIVLAVEPTMLCAPSAWLAARLARAKAWLHVQDFELDAALSLGLLPHKLARPAYALERGLMGAFDRVSTISEKMMERLAAKGVGEARSVLFPNWVDCTEIHPLTGPSRMRADLGIPPSVCVALYSGNMGEKQGLELLVAAADELQRERNLLFVLCGDGAARTRLQASATALPNVRWMPLQPVERLNALLNVADIHLLPQRADAADLVMPSKLTGMLASGRPVLATAHAGTGLAQVVNGCGVVTPPGDAAAFAAALRELQRHGIARRELGAAARRYAEQHLHKDAVLMRFERELMSCVAKKGDASK